MPSGRAQLLMLPPMSDEDFLGLRPYLGDIVDEVPAEKHPRLLQQHAYGHFELIPAI